MKIHEIPLSGRARHEIDVKPVRLKYLAPWFDRYRRQRRKILADNARDYRRAVSLKGALTQLASADVAKMSVAEGQIGNDWRPFRVEHTPSGSLRGNYGGGYSGDFSGRVSPNLRESSSVLFLLNEAGETLRVLIPSQGATREMLATALTAWANSAGHDRKHWYDRRSTHLGTVIHNFGMAEGWSSGLANAKTIDMLDASCQKSAEDRPVVQVMGRLLQDGVALATGLQVNGVMNVLLPTMFFMQLAGSVQRLGKISTGNHLVPTTT
ncbi:MAG: hypothetical protein AAB804_00955 [Patescibacteria group bacterium]